MKLAARVFLSLFLVISSLFIIGTTVNAQTLPGQDANQTIQQPANQNFAAPTDPNVPKNLDTWTQTVLLEVISAVDCQVTGVNPSTADNKCLGIDSRTGTIGFVENGGGAIGIMGDLISRLYTPPVHTMDYISYLQQNFGITKKAYAATGIGFDQLSPLIPIWSRFRDIMYLFFVGIFMLVGMAIMLRIKIDPRTVMTIENQIPKVIIGLVLITFSLAIAGFIIDLMYVSIYLLFNVFSSFSFIDHGRIVQAQQTFNGDNPFGVMDRTVGFPDIVANSAGSVKEIVQRIFATSANISTSGQGNTFIISGFLGLFHGITDVFKNFLGWTLGFLAGGLALLVIGIAVLWSMFRLWFQLLLAYGYTLMDIVLGPFWIAAGLLPGGGKGFLGWLRDLLSNLSAFPVTLGMFLLARAFMDVLACDSCATKGTGFIAPLIGNPQDIKVFGSLIGLSLILMTPQVVAITKDAFKAPEFKHTGSIRQALGTAPGMVGGIATAVGSPYGSLALYRNLRGEIGKTRAGKFMGGLLHVGKGDVEAQGPSQESQHG